MALLKIQHSFTDPDFDKNRTFACNLHLYHSRNHFAYMVTNMGKTRCLLFKAFEVDDRHPFLHELALEHEEISRFYRTATLMPANFPFCLVPGPVYTDRHAAEYYRLSFDQPMDESIISAEFEKAHITALLGMNTELWKHYKNFFQSFKVYSEGAQLFEWSLAAQPKDQLSAVIMLYPQHFLLVISRNGALELGNRYPMANNEELLYFLMNACEQLKIDTAGLNVYLAGETGRLNEMKAFITPYVQNVSEAQLNSGTDLSLIPDPELSRRYFTFLQTTQCE